VARQLGVEEGELVLEYPWGPRGAWLGPDQGAPDPEAWVAFGAAPVEA